MRPHFRLYYMYKNTYEEDSQAFETEEEVQQFIDDECDFMEPLCVTSVTEIDVSGRFKFK